MQSSLTHNGCVAHNEVHLKYLFHESYHITFSPCTNKAYETASVVSFNLKRHTVLNSKSYVLSVVFILYSLCRFCKRCLPPEKQSIKRSRRWQDSELDSLTVKP